MIIIIIVLIIMISHRPFTITNHNATRQPPILMYEFCGYSFNFRSMAKQRIDGNYVRFRFISLLLHTKQISVSLLCIRCNTIIVYSAHTRTLKKPKLFFLLRRTSTNKNVNISWGSIDDNFIFYGMSLAVGFHLVDWRAAMRWQQGEKNYIY